MNLPIGIFPSSAGILPAVSGKIVPASDGLLAATARRHSLHVMTRNSEHFSPTGVLLLNRWIDHEL
ncbi:MAG TPA: hypothetical protein VKF79_02870 [Candidatus Acidoferrum sp.]|nr:hypothetical protein [Candidatus Acidoferrum sp.]